MVATSEALAEYRKVWTTAWSLTDLRRFLDERVGPSAPLRLSVVLLDQELRWLESRPLSVREYLQQIPELRTQPTSVMELTIAETRLRDTMQQLRSSQVQSGPASVGGVSLQYFGDKQEPVTRLLDQDIYDAVASDQQAGPAHVPLLSDYEESPFDLDSPGDFPGSSGRRERWSFASADVSLPGVGLPSEPGWLAVGWETVCGFAQAWAPQIAVTMAALVLSALGAWQVKVWMTQRMEGSFLGEVRKDNRVEMPLVWITPTWGYLGSADGEPGRRADEDRVEVNLTQGFWMGQSEVSQDQYQSLMYGNPSHFSKTGEGRKVLPDLKTGTLPVENVSVAEMLEFCQRLTAIERQAGRLTEDWEYTLPTEAQWEIGARAGGQLTYGDSNRLSVERAHFDQGETGHSRSVTADSEKGANAWGLRDMLGNVAEACLDSYREELTAGRDPRHDTPSDKVVIRGGSWRSPMHDCRPASREPWGVKHRANWLGFRVALVPIQRQPNPAR